MGDVLPFRVARRGGYDPEEVDRTVTEIRSRVSSLEQQYASAEANRVAADAGRVAAERTIDRLTRELAEARSAVQRAHSKPTFADLGAAFEQTLRLAEEQAAKMIREASAEAKALRDGARGEAEELRRTSAQNAESVVQEADQKAGELKSAAERRAAEIENRAEAQIVEARTAKEEAELQGAGIRADAERYAAETRAKIHAEIEDAKAEVALLRQLAERDELRVRSEIKVAQDVAEQERMALHNEATKQVQRRQDEADRMLGDVAARASTLNIEAEEHLARARRDAANLLGTARSHAVDLISSARARAEKLAMRSNEHASRMLQDAELRLAVLEDQRHVIEEFAFELRSLSATDRIVEVDAPVERLGLLAAVEAEVASQTAVAGVEIPTQAGDLGNAVVGGVVTVETAPEA